MAVVNFKVKLEENNWRSHYNKMSLKKICFRLVLMPPQLGRENRPRPTTCRCLSQGSIYHICEIWVRHSASCHATVICDCACYHAPPAPPPRPPTPLPVQAVPDSQDKINQATKTKNEYSLSSWAPANTTKQRSSSIDAQLVPPAISLAAF